MKRWPLSYLLFAGVLLLQTVSGLAQEGLDKPRVAIKTPVVGEGVRGDSGSYLNLQSLVAEMESAIQMTRKFHVVTRQKGSLTAIREEQKFRESGLTKGNAARGGRFENANYLVMPTIQTFEFSHRIEPVPNIDGKYRSSDEGLLEVQVQIVDTETGQIKATFYLRSARSVSGPIVNYAEDRPSGSHFSMMAKEIAAQLADQLVDAVFPMRVMNVEGDQVWINRGKDGGLGEGDILEVYRPGKELIDPYTKERLGTAEVLLGKVQVVRVNPKFTLGKMVGTEPGFTARQGDLVRKP